MATSLTTKSSPNTYKLLAGVNVTNPTHDITLADIEGNTAGLILCNRSGRQDSRGLQFASVPRTALQMSQGNGGYDDMLPPFVTEVQSTFIGGRGQDTLDTDRTRFADSYRLDTTKEFPICAPKVSAQTGISEGDVTFGGTPTYQIDVTSAAGMTTYTPSNTTTITGLTVRIACSLLNPNDWAKLCYSLVVSQTTPTCADYVTASDFDSSVLIMNNIYYPGETINLSANTTVEAGKTVYIIMKAFSFTGLVGWGSIKVFTAPVTDVNFYRTSSIYQWELVESNAFLDCTINTIINYDIKMFEYRRQLYAIKNDLNRAGASLYINGWRGVADVNTSYSVLADATQTGIATWANDAAKGCIVLIINGTGENQAQPWRYVSSSADGVLTLSTQWDIKPDTTTEYVVLNSDKWFVVSTTVGEVDYMAKAVTSVAAVKDYLVFAFGDADEMSYYRFGCVSGAASEKWAVDTANKADMLCPIVNEYGDLKLWRADCDDCWVDCADVPDWLTPWTSPPALLFDVNAHERADLLLQQQRAVVDWDTENAKTTNKDTGYLKSLERTILDLDYQISSHAAEGEAVGTGPDLVDPEGVAYITTAASTAHKYLPTKIYCGNTNARITNIIGYGQPEIPYILKEDGFGSVYNNVYQQMPVGEMSSVRSEDNGKSAMQFGVYMYFNLAGGMLERYYDQRLDDIGPNRDEGMPEIRQGEFVKILPYPGRFYAAMNAGFSGYSSILCNNMLGWHEIYRTSALGIKIKDIYIQSIPGNQYVDRLWISEGMDLIALPIALAPLSQSQYPYFGYRDPTNSGYVETSWIDFDLKDVEKYFHSVTIFSDYSAEVVSGSEYALDVYFRVDGDTEWSYGGHVMAAETIDGKLQVGVKDLELRYYSPIHQTPHNVSGKKIKLRIRMTPMASEYETPRLKAVLVNAVLRMPVKRSWNVTFMLEPIEDLQKRQLTDAATLLYNQLYTWANSKTHATPLLMRTNDALADNKYVFIDPASISPFQAASQMAAGSGQKEYRHIASMTIYEV